jgi:hypothetical protein
MTVRDRRVIAIVLTLAVILGGWFVVIQPKRDEASKLGDQVASAQSELTSARAQVIAAQSDKSTYARNYTALARLGEAVPEDDNVPSLIFQLQNAASGAQVDFRAMKLVPASGAAAPAVAPPAATPPAGTTVARPGTATPASAANTASAGPVTSQASTAALPPGAAVGPAGFPTLPFTFTFQGNFFHLSDFLNRLQRFVVATNKRVSVSGRLMTLNAITLGAAKQGFPQITATISATSYLVPAAQGLLNGATPSGPAAGASQTVSSAGSSTPAPAVITPPVR